MDITNLVFSGKPVSIYSVVNELDKKIYIQYSTNTLLSLANLVENNVIPKEDRNKVQIVFIETHTVSNELYLRYKVDLLYKEYINKGYTVYTSYKPLDWILYVRVYRPSGVDKLKGCRAVIKLKTSHNKRYVIKVCISLEEANKYIQDNTMEQVLYNYTVNNTIQ